MAVWQAPSIVVVHLTRRTDMAEARQLLETALGPDQAARVHFLMDHRNNRQRYEQQELNALA
jgi:hypothetical protein